MKKKLCRQHLLGEHVELHAIWSILTKNKKGYSHHPEVLRWQGKLNALYKKHDKIAAEMIRRGYSHNTPLDKKLAKNTSLIQKEFVDSIKEQKRILKQKGCECRV